MAEGEIFKNFEPDTKYNLRHPGHFVTHGRSTMNKGTLYYVQFIYIYSLVRFSASDAFGRVINRYYFTPVVPSYNPLLLLSSVQQYILYIHIYYYMLSLSHVDHQQLTQTLTNKKHTHI